MRRALLLSAVLAASLQSLHGRAYAESIVINLAGDEPDADPSDATPDVDLATAGLQVTLRSALEYSNQTPDPDEIEIEIVLGGGNATILPATPLPEVLGPIQLDGRISGGRARIQGQGLVLRAPGCAISHLIIDGAPVDAITAHDPGELLLANVDLLSSGSGLGVRARGLVSLTHAVVSNNALGGVLSAEGRIIGSHLTVESNGGPGLIARDGIRMLADPGFPNRVRANGGGLYSDGNLDLQGPGGQEISGNFGDGLRTLGTMLAEGEVEIVDNASFGVRARGDVQLGEKAVVSGNGRGFTVVVPDAIEFELSLWQISGPGQIRGGGALSASGGLHGGELIATDNGGPALLCALDLSFEHVAIARNDGDGIQAGTFVSLGTAEIEDNAGFGVNAGESFFLDGDSRISRNAASGIAAFGVLISGAGRTFIESNGKGDRARIAKFDDALEVSFEEGEPLREGVFATAVEAFNVEVSDSGGDGILAWFVDLTDAAVTDNANAGVRMTDGNFLRTVVCDNAGGDLEVNGELRTEATVICDRPARGEPAGCGCCADGGLQGGDRQLLLILTASALVLRRSRTSARC